MDKANNSNDLRDVDVWLSTTGLGENMRDLRTTTRILEIERNAEICPFWTARQMRGPTFHVFLTVSTLAIIFIPAKARVRVSDGDII